MKTDTEIHAKTPEMGRTRPGFLRSRISGWSVRRRTLVSVTGVLLGLVLLAIVGTGSLMRQIESQQESRENQETLEHALHLVAGMEEMALKVTRDYGSWDEAAGFVEGNNPGFKESYLHDTGLTNLGINFIAYLDRNNRVVYARHTGKKEESASGSELVVKYPSLMPGKPGLTRVSGLVKQGKTLMLAASAPVLDSNFKPPARGRIIVGIDLDQKAVESISTHTRFNTAIIPLEASSQLPGNIHSAALALTPDRPEAMAPLPGNYAAILRLLSDVSGNPAAILQVNRFRETREIYHRWTIIFHVGLTLMLVVAVITIMWLLTKNVLIPLEELDRGISRLSVEGPASFRFADRTGGEFGALAEGLNHMLNSILAMQARLSQSEVQYRELVETANSIIMRMDPAGNIIFINQFGRDFFGFSNEELMGRNIIGTIVPETGSDGNDLRAMVRDILANPAKHTSNESENQTKTGQRKRIAWTNRVIRAQDETVIDLLCIGNDVTSQRQMEMELAETRKEVNNLHKMEALGRMAGGIAHDLNNILAVISGYTEMVAEKAAENPACSRYTGEILKGVRRAGDLSSQLLVLSRKQVAEAQVLDPGPVLEETVKLLRGMLGEGVMLSCFQEEDIPAVKIDPLQLQQMLISLAMNARDAMPNGGSLAIRASRVEILPNGPRQAAGMPAGPAACISVEDSGTGMDKQALAHLFEPFFTTKPKGLGIGMGLSMVYALAHKHRGHVEVESREGKGTTVRILLPKHAPDRTGEPRQKAVPAAAPGGENILLVEDHADLREMARELLEKRGYRVMTAEDGQSGLDLASDLSTPIDLVLTDIVMPRLNGREMAERLKKLRPGIKLAYMSGFTAEASQFFEQNEGGIVFLPKPFSTAQLLETIRRGLAQPGS
jgi:PAS domain S-box-containing protein